MEQPTSISILCKCQLGMSCSLGSKVAQTDRQTDIETYLGLGDDPMEIYDKPNYHLNFEA